MWAGKPQRSNSEIRFDPNEFTEEFSMGSCGTLDGIRGLDANHLSITAESELARTITRIASAKHVVAAAAKAGTAQSGTRCHSGPQKRALLKRKAQYFYFSSRHHTSFVSVPLRRIGPVACQLEGRLPSFNLWDKFSRKNKFFSFFAEIRFTSDDMQQEPRV